MIYLFIKLFYIGGNKEISKINECNKDELKQDFSHLDGIIEKKDRNYKVWRNEKEILNLKNDIEGFKKKIESKKEKLNKEFSNKFNQLKERIKNKSKELQNIKEDLKIEKENKLLNNFDLNRSFIFNLTEFKKEFIYKLENNKNLRKKFEVKLGKLKRTYKISNTIEGSENFRILQKLCTRIEWNFENKIMICKSGKINEKQIEAFEMIEL